MFSTNICPNSSATNCKVMFTLIIVTVLLHMILRERKRQMLVKTMLECGAAAEIVRDSG